MIPDSKDLAHRKALGEKFASAAAKSFLFLEQADFAACPWETQNQEDYRDTAFVLTYVRKKSAIDVRLELATRQICIVVFEYETDAACAQRPAPQTVIDLDEWIEQHELFVPPPLAWMKTKTFYQEVQRNFRYFFKQVDRDIDAAVDFMAQRLRSSGLHNNTR